jgi:hypothetical protein
MTPLPASAPRAGDFFIPARYWTWLGTPRAAAALVWLAAVACGLAFAHRALHWFDVPDYLTPERKRLDGNCGHAQIDFGGQWVMGRMIVTGNGRQLYHRQKQWQIVRESYPVADECPLQQYESPLPVHWRKVGRPDEDLQHDSTNLMSWFMGSDQEPAAAWKKVGGATALPFAQPVTGQPLVAVALEKAAADAVTPEVEAKLNEPHVGGPLYPPVHALFYAPLALIDRPQVAYQVLQLFCALLVPFTGYGVKVLTRGRIWWSVATLCLYAYPGMRGGLDLGQNPSISVCIAVWGWALASRGYNVAGGMMWGLFAFKPVWAAAFLLVPLLMRRWRFALAMVLTGAAFGLATLPLVGLDAWFHWLKIGGWAAKVYETNTNWIDLSRDLQGVVRRALIDFDKPDPERDTPLIHGLAWGLWGAVLATTVAVYTLRADRTRPTGVGAGFLFLGAYLTCFHFMYYDSLISAAALAVLFADPKRFVPLEPFALAPAEAQTPPARELTPAARTRPFGARMLCFVNSVPLTLVAALFLVENSFSGLELEATVGIGRLASPAADGSTHVKVPRVQGGSGVRYPLDTFVLMALWAWCGWCLLARREPEEMVVRSKVIKS